MRHGLRERSESGRRDGMAPRWFGPLDRLDRLDHGVMNGDPRLSVALYYELITSN